MKKLTYFILLFFLLSCREEKTRLNVGEIVYDAELDAQDFELCNEKKVPEYYGRVVEGKPATYSGEMYEVYKKYDGVDAQEITGENGYITIRFIVNCHGKSGRFRVQEMGFDYKPKRFDPELVEQLLAITKSLDGWIPPVDHGGTAYDFYQYLSFRIENGNLTNIMP